MKGKVNTKLSTGLPKMNNKLTRLKSDPKTRLIKKKSQEPQMVKKGFII